MTEVLKAQRDCRVVTNKAAGAQAREGGLNPTRLGLSIMAEVWDLS